MGSFSSKKVNTFNFFYVNGVIGDNELLFLFDTGSLKGRFFRLTANHP